MRNAEEKGSVLAKLRINRIYSSDLGRCVQTAEIINNFVHAPIAFSNKLRERDFGEFNGRSKSELEIDFYDMDTRTPGGETLNEVKERVLKFLETLDPAETSPLLIVTHAGVVRLLLSEMLKREVGDPICTPPQDFIGKFEIENGKPQNFEFVK